MGVDRAPPARGTISGSAAHDGFEGSVERYPVCLALGLPLAVDAEGFPPRSTVQRYFAAWRDEGLWAGVNHALLTAAREAEGREATPSAGVIDSQSVKSTESGGPRGVDAGKKVKGRKRHIVTDTGGLLLAAQVYAADIQDRDGAPGVFAAIPHAFPSLRHVFADGAYAGPKLEGELKRIGRWTLEIVKRSDCPGLALHRQRSTPR